MFLNKAAPMKEYVFCDVKCPLHSGGGTPAQPQTPHVLDDVIQCPIHEVLDCLNVLLCDTLQAHAEVGLPCAAIVPGIQKQVMR